MPRHLNITVAGGFDLTAPSALDQPPDAIIEFAQSLGREIVRQGHNLLTGCQTELDKFVAAAAHAELRAHNTPVERDAQRIQSFVMEGNSPIHSFGSVLRSELSDWDIGGLQPIPPEVISRADAVVLLGGFYGTFKAANWARIARKPLLPFAIFGGAAKEVYSVEAKRFDQVYPSHVPRDQYDRVLRSLSTEWGHLAIQTINLVEKIVTPPSVFVIMSFREAELYTELYSTIKQVCERYEYTARNVDESNLFSRIIPEIMRQIRHCAFVIADVTEAKPNVFYELGLAHGLGKEVILIAKKGTKLPFDITDIPVLFWEGFTRFAEELRKRVEAIGVWQGRPRAAPE